MCVCNCGFPSFCKPTHAKILIKSCVNMSGIFFLYWTVCSVERLECLSSGLTCKASRRSDMNTHSYHEHRHTHDNVLFKQAIKPEIELMWNQFE